MFPPFGQAGAHSISQAPVAITMPGDAYIIRSLQRLSNLLWLRNTEGAQCVAEIRFRPKTSDLRNS